MGVGIDKRFLKRLLGSTTIVPLVWLELLSLAYVSGVTRGYYQL